MKDTCLRFLSIWIETLWKRRRPPSLPHKGLRVFAFLTFPLPRQLRNWVWFATLKARVIRNYRQSLLVSTHRQSGLDLALASQLALNFQRKVPRFLCTSTSSHIVRLGKVRPLLVRDERSLAFFLFVLLTEQKIRLNGRELLLFGAKPDLSQS